MSDLPRLASLLKSRNTIDSKIATLIGQPTSLQSVGEYIASDIFGIAIGKSAMHRNSNGRFIRGPLIGKTVDIQCRVKHNGTLHLKTDPLPRLLPGVRRLKRVDSHAGPLYSLDYQIHLPLSGR